MTQISTAIDLTRVSRVVGYKVKPGNFSPNTPYLPQRIAILGEANTANQATMSTDAFEFTTAKEVGDEYGYGSPLHIMARILRPISGDPLGGIPTIIYANEEAAAGTAAVYKLGITGTATANVTHRLKINGRDNIDGVPYEINIETGDTPAAQITKWIAAVNAVTASPVTASDGTTTLDLTTKWKGATAVLDVEVETYDVSGGVTYAEDSNTDGTGTPADITTQLTAFGDNWNTIVINPFGSDQLATFEAFNGVPDPTTPTGRYDGTVFKPFIALFGGLESTVSAVETITDASGRKDQVTNVYCPAPNSAGFAFEAAANGCMTCAPIMQNTPHLDNSKMTYPDMPVPADENIGDFSTYANRDRLVKAGASTVNLTSGKYTVQDFVTTYHPDGVNPPKFRFVRDIAIDWNIGFSWKIIMERDIQDKAIVPNNSPSRVAGTISVKQGKQLLISHIELMAARAFLGDVDFSITSIQVGINESNPARLDFFYKYKRTSTAHIVSTDATVDFNFSA